VNTDIELINKHGTIMKDSKKIQDLGKVDLILTNQSGTLTKNERYFRYCVIAEGCYEYRNDGKPSSLNSKKNLKNMLIAFH
jgi:magnesium-transporting ATPase (P-type)